MSKGKAQSYSDLAGEYDQKRFEGEGGRFNFELDQSIIVDWVNEVGAGKVIDVPVGTGRVLVYLKDVDCDVTGLDYTEEMLERARAVVSPERQQVMQGDASAMEFEDNSFDCLISLRFFHLFARNDREPFASEFRRVVRPGGHAIIGFTNGWYVGGLNWVKKFLGMRTVQFGYPFEMSRLFPGWQVIAVRGNFLPKQRLLAKIPGLGSLLSFLTRVAPVNRVCWETYYLVRKPDSQ